MKLRKGDDHYFFASFSGSFQLMKIEVLNDYEGEYGLGASFVVLWEINNMKDGSLFRKGVRFSGNQLVGVNTAKGGLTSFLYKNGDRNLIRSCYEI